MTEIARLPYDAAVGAEIDYTFDTGVSESAGGISGRVGVRGVGGLIRQFHLTIGPEDVEEVIALHTTRRGRRWPVAVRNWAKYEFEDEDLAYTTSGSNVLAPMRRLVVPSTGTEAAGSQQRYYYERILVPDENETNVVLAVNGTPISRGSWTFSNFGIAVVPSATVGAGQLTATGRYMVPACFMDDTLTVKVLIGSNPDTGQDAILSIPDVALREILEEELISLMAQTDDSA